MYQDLHNVKLGFTARTKYSISYALKFRVFPKLKIKQKQKETELKQKRVWKKYFHENKRASIRTQ